MQMSNAEIVGKFNRIEEMINERDELKEYLREVS